MQIDYKNSIKGTELRNVVTGDCFMFAGYAYMKTDETMLTHCSCVNLQTGAIINLVDDTIVFCVDAKLTVKGIFDDTDKL